MCLIFWRLFILVCIHVCWGIIKNIFPFTTGRYFFLLLLSVQVEDHAATWCIIKAGTGEMVVFWQLPQVPQTWSRMTRCIAIKVKASGTLPLFVHKKCFIQVENRKYTSLFLSQLSRCFCFISLFSVRFFTTLKQWTVLTPILSYPLHYMKWELLKNNINNKNLVIQM